MFALTGPAAAATINLYAAGSLQAALSDVAKTYQSATGNTVSAKYGPSGLLKNEISEGAKADVFRSSASHFAVALALPSPDRSAINSTENAVATSPARRWEVPIARHHFVIIEFRLFMCHPLMVRAPSRHLATA